VLNGRQLRVDDDQFDVFGLFKPLADLVDLPLTKEGRWTCFL